MNTIPELIERAYSQWDAPKVLGFVGTELESRSRLPFARNILTRALELDPISHPEWYLTLAFAHFRDVGNLSGDGERILIDGIETTDSDFLKAAYLSILESGETANGVDDLIEYLLDVPSVSVQLALGYSFLWRGETERALQHLREAIVSVDEQMLDGTLPPLGIENYAGAMNWMRGQGMDINLTTEVLPYLRALIATYPNVYNYRSLTIQLFQTLRDYGAVKDTALETLKVFPDEETTMVALASAFEKLQDDDQAILWYNRAIGAKPSYSRARVMLGKLYERRGQPAVAEQVFREISSAFPEYHAGKLEIAYFLHRVGKKQEASSLFRFGYDRLKTFEKSAVEHHPEGKLLLEEMNKLSLPVL